MAKKNFLNLQRYRRQKTIEYKAQYAARCDDSFIGIILSRSGSVICDIRHHKKGFMRCGKTNGLDLQKHIALCRSWIWRLKKIIKANR